MQNTLFDEFASCFRFFALLTPGIAKIEIFFVATKLFKYLSIARSPYVSTSPEHTSTQFLPRRGPAFTMQGRRVYCQLILKMPLGISARIEKYGILLNDLSTTSEYYNPLNECPRLVTSNILWK